MNEMTWTKTDPTFVRKKRAMQDPALDSIRNLPSLETKFIDFLRALEAGTVATNVFLRLSHHFALDMSWLPWPVLPKKQCPKVHFKSKRAITWKEHQAIVAAELNLERRAFFGFCWHLGGAQSEVASLSDEDIDSLSKVVGFRRRKAWTISNIWFGEELGELRRSRPRPQAGPLFPRLQKMRAAHRATEFARCRRRLNLKGVTLRCYRYAWAERARRSAAVKRLTYLRFSSKWSWRYARCAVD